MALAFPPIYLLRLHLDDDTLHELEGQIPSLTFDTSEAEIFLGKISKQQRALVELRHLNVTTEEITGATPSSHTAKRRKISGAKATVHLDSDTDSDDGEAQTQYALSFGGRKTSTPTVKVVRLAWFTDSVARGEVLPLEKYLIYEGQRVSQAKTLKESPLATQSKSEDILRRAKAYATRNPPPRDFSRKRGRRGGDTSKPHTATIPSLVRQTTTEFEDSDSLPPIPAFLDTTYSCQRPTPGHPPNEPFIEELKMIRTTRQLNGDKVGVRAYSTAIASLAAYPYTLSSVAEVERLPGCGLKIALLFREFKDNGRIKEAADAEADEKLSVVKKFYEIWGVADTTSHEFYRRGWRDIEDVVEFGWDSLSRVQQIGVKYYDEFQVKIPRVEVEAIANVVLTHANKIQPGFQMVIVGGYRRGKALSGDVDVILSHPEESATSRVIVKLIESLEKDKFVTHTLTLSTKNSERGQMPVDWKGEKIAGSGFDTLDKAMVVWQDPVWDASEEPKNTNPHRRVDVIISPWKTAGCAVLGWTSGTTFQRDLRRYCKKERSLKFDSSGVRSRADGSWVDLEDGGLGKAPDMLTAERRVFAGLGLEWRAPEERCTG